MEKAWNDFIKYYDKKAGKYTKEKELSSKDIKEAHWVCWNEDDFMLHIGRFIYKHLEKEGMDDIEIHLNKRINKENFKNYLFSENENEMLKKLKEKIGKYPKADLIIAKETDFDNPFLLCGEAKFFHYYVDIEKELKTDIEELKELKELGIAKEVALLIFDDYYHFRKSKKEKEIENMIKDANSKEIKVFYRESSVKLP